VFNPVVCARPMIAAVKASIASFPQREALTAAPAPAPPAPAGYLPELETQWEHYWPVVSDYASDPPPRADDRGRARLPAPALFEDSTLLLGDPAWPAEIPLDPEELRICEACVNTVRIGELAADHDVIHGLVRKGALIVSHTEPA
jgi:hypothetical protein